MKEDRKMTSSTVSGSLSFVDREEEMKRIKNSLKRTSTGEGELLIIRGEAGSGKTRLLQEAAAEAEKQGFSVGFGTALAESVVPYHPWKEVLEGLGLDVILKELPPPKLFGLYLITADGDVKVKVEREGAKSKLLSDLISSLEESVTDSKAQKRLLDGDFILVGRDGHKSILWQGSDVHLGAIVEGDEDEGFLADIMALGDKAESILSGETHEEGDPYRIVKTHLRQLLDSEIYEGIDYAREDPKMRQNKLFEHVALGLSRRAKGSSLCVLIDDLQWADPSSLELLRYVARNTRKTGVSILGTYRAEEAESRPQLKESLEGMDQEETLNKMDLNGLTREHLADLVRSFIGSHVLPEDFLDHLWQETRGFPLFVREVMVDLEDDGEIATQGSVKCLVRPLEEIALPKRVRDVIRRRLDQLPDEDRRLLDAAATCGSRFTASIVSKVAGEEEAKVLNGLGAIARIHGLLRLTDSGFAFDHPAVQEVLYDCVPAEIRQTYHRKAALWLELAGGPVEDIGEHYYRARDRRAVAVLNDAASEARTKYANKEAIRFYTEALELEEDEQKRMGMLYSLGDVCDSMGDLEKGLESFKGALAYAQEKDVQVGILNRIGRMRWKRGEIEECVRAHTEALSLLEDDGCKEEAMALDGLGCAYESRGDFDQALEYYERSLAIGEEIADQEVIARALTCKANIHNLKGEFGKAIENHEKSIKVSERIGNLVGVAGACMSAGAPHVAKGEYDRALELYEKGLAIYEKMGNRVGIAGFLNNIGNIHSLRGENRKALEYFERSLELSERAGARYYAAIHLMFIGMVHREEGEYDKSLEYLEKSLGTFKKIGDRGGLNWSYCELVQTFLKRKELGKAMEFCKKALNLSEELGSKGHLGESRRFLGMIYCEQGRWDLAAENFEESIRIFEGIGAKNALAKSHREFGLMWKQKGDMAEANEHLARALELFEALNLPKSAAEAREAFDAPSTEV